MSAIESTATTTETISDSSGNPILFLSTYRYQNEFREMSKLGKGGRSMGRPEGKGDGAGRGRGGVGRPQSTVWACCDDGAWPDLGGRVW
jgi:hypothetical protein